jgi:hypothetical protein
MCDLGLMAEFPMERDLNLLALCLLNNLDWSVNSGY